MESRVSPLLRPYLSLSILIVNDEDYNSENLKSMVRSVNSTEVPIEDILSDSVYYFDRNSGDIRMIG